MPRQVLFVVFYHDTSDIPYLVGGSLASSLLGEPCSTADIDLVADLRFSQVRAFKEAVQPDFYVSEDAVREVISYQSSFNLLHQATMSKVDIFILKDQTFAGLEFSRRTPVHCLTSCYAVFAPNLALFHC